MSGVELAEIAASWAPEPTTTTSCTSAWSVAAFSGLLDLDPVAGEGDPLPPLWHWFGFLEHTRQDELGDDGHPTHGTFLPPIPHRRRMFAGGRLEVHRAMRVGEELVRRSTLAGTAVKRGRSGEMLFATVRHEFFRDRELLVSEEQDYAYRSQLPGQERGIAAAADPGEPAPAGPEAVDLAPDETMLFRFSALTYNTHRIHYDRSYVTSVEGYPDLVVHGPLLALMLVEIPRRHRAGRGVARCDYRLARPAFAGSPLRAEPTADPPEDDAALRVAAGVPGAPPSITATLSLTAQEDLR